ncbi:MAG: transcriptional regulator, HTH-type [Herbinix sp.]|jgi:predicted DNA-binding transcriptional regulator YafY|nr:transcriptional regulator, HTH-type [Herbinix sp.]
MQINRLFETVYILIEKKTITAKELAERFEVSVRTIYRDIDILSSAGIPIYASQGKGGGISLMEHFILNKSVLTENEQNEILFALQSLSIAQNLETERVLSKLSSLFNKNIANWIEVDLSPWGSNKNQKCEFTLLKNAILNRNVIEFDYFNAAGEKGNRRVEPVKLIFKVNAWYLQGFCLLRNARRSFKISRMSNVWITQENFPEREVVFEDTQAKIPQNWINIQIKFTDQMAYRIYDEYNENEIIKNKDGSFSVSTTLPENNWLISYLLSFGKDAEVLAPQHICDKMKEQGEKIFGIYNNDNGNLT